MPRADLADNFDECDITKFPSLLMGNEEGEVPKVTTEPFLMSFFRYAIGC